MFLCQVEKLSITPRSRDPNTLNCDTVLYPKICARKSIYLGLPFFIIDLMICRSNYHQNSKNLPLFGLQSLPSLLLPCLLCTLCTPAQMRGNKSIGVHVCTLVYERTGGHFPNFMEILICNDV